VLINGTYGAQLLPVGVIGPLHINVPYLPQAVKRRLATTGSNNVPSPAPALAVTPTRAFSEADTRNHSPSPSKTDTV
jgi:hypothetical protein